MTWTQPSCYAFLLQLRDSSIQAPCLQGETPRKKEAVFYSYLHRLEHSRQLATHGRCGLRINGFPIIIISEGTNTSAADTQFYPGALYAHSRLAILSMAASCGLESAAYLETAGKREKCRIQHARSMGPPQQTNSLG